MVESTCTLDIMAFVLAIAILKTRFKSVRKYTSLILRPIMWQRIHLRPITLQ